LISLEFPALFRETDKELAQNAWRPRSLITETKEGDVLITAEMPGLSKEDINVDLHNGVLTIKGSKKEENKDEKTNTHTRSKRSFFR
jgi:HSP20 family protein